MPGFTGHSVRSNHVQETRIRRTRRVRGVADPPRVPTIRGIVVQAEQRMPRMCERRWCRGGQIAPGPVLVEISPRDPSNRTASLVMPFETPTRSCSSFLVPGRPPGSSCSTHRPMIKAACSARLSPDFDPVSAWVIIFLMSVFSVADPAVAMFVTW